MYYTDESPCKIVQKLQTCVFFVRKVCFQECVSFPWVGAKEEEDISLD